MFGLLIAASLMRCSTESNPLAPYEGERPLEILAVTQSFTPQIQWVGGRVAAIGVNRDSTAALDSTLVWMMTADDNSIESFVEVGDDGSSDLVAQYGGVPLDSLEDGGTYTFWMAERDVLDAELDTSSFDGYNFVDTTVTLDLVLTGRSWGGVDVDITIVKEETLSSTQYVVSWTPGDVAFREIGVNYGGNPGFSNLVWHAVTPEGAEDGIVSPIVIGESPSGTDEAVSWSGFQEVETENGLEVPTHHFWMVNSDWDVEEADFGFRTEGLAYFQILKTNFEQGGEE